MLYEQLVVMQGCDFKEADKEVFYEVFKKHKFKKPKIVGVVETLPSRDECGNIIPNTGGRKDLFFFINNKDINKFAVWRFLYSMRWWEDIFYNHEENIYPDDFKEQYPPRW